MGRFSGILLQVDAADADDTFARCGADRQASIYGQGLLILGDLIALGQVWVEVVLTLKNAGVSDLTFQCQGHPQGVFNRPLIGDRQYARHPRANRANSRIWRCLGQIHHRTGAEHF